MLPEVVFHLPTGNYLQLYILKKKKSFKIYINHLIYKLLVLYMLLQIK